MEMWGTVHHHAIAQMTIMTEHSPRFPLIDELFAESERRMISNYELAHELKVSPKTVLYWRRHGVRPQLRHQRKILTWLGRELQNSQGGGHQ